MIRRVMCVAGLWILAAQGMAAQRPNIILVMTDDQGYGEVGFNGNPVLKTPNLDRFAEEGTQLTQFYVSPMCTPTRSSLMTGRYHFRTGAHDTYIGRSNMNPQETTIAEVFAGAGYRTGIFGKWHLGENYPMRAVDQGFQEVVIHGGGGLGQFADYPGNGNFSPTLLYNDTFKKSEGYCTDVFVDESIRWMKEDLDAPFFCYLSLNAPHAPFSVAQEFRAPYDKLKLVDPDGHTWAAPIYGMITHMDGAFQRLLDAVEAMGLKENTILIFMTDNGPNSTYYTAGLRAKKGSSYENGIRVPFVIRWPAGIPGGRKLHDPMMHIDMLPTLAQACGITLPDGLQLDGQNLLPLLKGEIDALPERYLFMQHNRGNLPTKYRNGMARKGPWKMVGNKGQRKGFELYNIDEDPGETHDLAARHPAKVEELVREYDRWFDEVTTDLRSTGGLPHPIELNPVQTLDFRFTWQDWWGDKTGWSLKNYGRWHMHNPGLIERFDVTLIPHRDHRGIPANVKFIWQEQVFEKSFDQLPDKIVHKNLTLAEGTGFMEAQLFHDGEMWAIKEVQIKPHEPALDDGSRAALQNMPTLNKLGYIDWPGFMARQDMVWTKVPKRWNEAPFFGNGMIGLFLYQERNNPDNTYSTDEKNVLSLHLGRGDYYDNRDPLDGDPHTWIYRGRLPIGFFRIVSKGAITGVDWRMDLWNARLVGTVSTTAGSYQIEGKVHALYDSFYWKVIPSGGESVDFEWQPQKATSYARMVSERAVERGKLSGGEVSHFYTTFAATPYPEAPEVKVVESPQGNTSRQVLYGDSGELVVAWKAAKDPSDGSTALLASIAFSREMGVALPEAKRDLTRAAMEVKADTYTQTHEEWWHTYYPRSFVSISDDFWEQFYWIQMYKLASASRADGMMLDTAGPWYQPGFHPLVWSDLNVQLCYWAQLTANRTEVGKSLLNVMDRNIENLSNNVHPDWRNDCLDANTVFPGNDLIAPIPYKKVADHVVWMLHNYWLFCQYENDTDRMRDGLFPLLKRANATYLRYIEDHPMDLGDGKLHFKHTWSPEAATGVDMNYTIALARWSSRILLEINEAHQLNDPKAPEWQNLLDNLVGWQADENGLRLGRDYPFEHAHRHYSHLLAFYPLFDLTPDKDRDLIRKSVDHWLAVTENPGKVKDTAMPVTGYTCTGAASMYASLGDGEKAFEYLKKFTFMNIYANTLYAEGKEQLIETPMSAASAIHDMLLQSWGGRICIMPGVPDAWGDIHYQTLLCEGGATVSADRSGGLLGFAKIESPDIARTIEFSVPMEEPHFVMLKTNQEGVRIELRKNDAGFYQVELPADGALYIEAPEVVREKVTPVKSPTRLKNIFGNNGQYETVREQFKTASFREPIGVTK